MIGLVAEVGELLSFAADKISRFRHQAGGAPLWARQKADNVVSLAFEPSVERDGRAFFHATSFEDVPYSVQAFVFDEHR